MKKIFAVLLVLSLSLVSLSCLASGFGFGDMFSGTSVKVNYPKEFRIAYEMEDGGRFVRVSLARDAKGNIHYTDRDSECLFVKSGKGYKYAVRTTKGFVLMNNDVYSWNYLRDKTDAFWRMAEPFEEYSLGKTEITGSGTVVGRKTKTYTNTYGFSYSLSGMDMSLGESTVYEIDEETGICLAMSETSGSSIGGYRTNDSGAQFECVEFETTNITLPEVTD